MLTLTPTVNLESPLSWGGGCTYRKCVHAGTGETTPQMSQQAVRFESTTFLLWGDTHVAVKSLFLTLTYWKQERGVKRVKSSPFSTIPQRSDSTELLCARTSQTSDAGYDQQVSENTVHGSLLLMGPCSSEPVRLPRLSLGTQLTWVKENTRMHHKSPIPTSQRQRLKGRAVSNTRAYL